MKHEAIHFPKRDGFSTIGFLLIFTTITVFYILDIGLYFYLSQDCKMDICKFLFLGRTELLIEDNQEQAYPVLSNHHSSP